MDFELKINHLHDDDSLVTEVILSEALGRALVEFLARRGGG
jgi:hypothetical protein